MLTGTFTGLDEGGVVDSFGDMDLFITCAACNGNDVALYSVPEPSTLILLAAGLPVLLKRRRRRG